MNDYMRENKIEPVTPLLGMSPGQQQPAAALAVERPPAAAPESSTELVARPKAPPKSKEPKPAET